MARESDSYVVGRREFLRTAGILSLAPTLAGGMTTPQIEKVPAAGEISLPEPVCQMRPAWWREAGVVMAGVDWESLLTRLRSGSFDWSQAFMTYEEKMAWWRTEHSEEVAQRLKEMGFNFVMIPLYKGGGLKAERTSMEDAKRFTAVCYKLGLRVGCYAFSGTILYESMLAENPEAEDWLTRDHNGRYVTYSSLYFRRWVNRSHPGVRALVRELVRFAVEEAKVDLIHFDNYCMGPGYEPFSVRQFREYLKNKYTPEVRKRRFGFAELEYVQPSPPPPEPDAYNGDPLYQDFVDYRCEVLANTYQELADYARSLNPEIVVECNPGAYFGELYASLGIGTVDHPRLIQWGGAFWDEETPSRLEKGVLISHFRSQMLVCRPISNWH